MGLYDYKAIFAARLKCSCDLVAVLTADCFCNAIKQKKRIKLVNLTLIKTLAIFFQNIKFCKVQSRVNF